MNGVSAARRNRVNPAAVTGPSRPRSPPRRWPRRARWACRTARKRLTCDAGLAELDADHAGPSWRGWGLSWLPGWLPGSRWWAVAADDLAVGAGDPASAVGADGQGPAELVQQHVVVPGYWQCWSRSATRRRKCRGCRRSARHPAAATARPAACPAGPAAGARPPHRARRPPAAPCSGSAAPARRGVRRSRQPGRPPRLRAKQAQGSRSIVLARSSSQPDRPSCLTRQ